MLRNALRFLLPPVSVHAEKRDRYKFNENIMKKLTIALLIILTSFTTFSQPKMSVDERLKIIEQKICKPLSLDKEKSEKIKAYFKEFFVEVDKLSINGNRPERKKVEVLAQNRDKKIKLILNEEQYKKYLKLEPETRPKERP